MPDFLSRSPCSSGALANVNLSKKGALPMTVCNHSPTISHIYFTLSSEHSMQIFVLLMSLKTRDEVMEFLEQFIRVLDLLRKRSSQTMPGIITSVLLFNISFDIQFCSLDFNQSAERIIKWKKIYLTFILQLVVDNLYGTF